MDWKTGVQFSEGAGIFISTMTSWPTPVALENVTKE
jgi:hypothetical protein